MGRRQQNNEPTAVVVHSSSIALLQERFKQLERVKVMREERELLSLRGGSFVPPPPPPRALRVPEGADGRTERHPKWFLHTELLRPSRPLSVPRACACPSSSSDFRALELEAPSLSTATGFRQYTGTRPSTHNSWNVTVAEAADIDTSLHL